MIPVGHDDRYVDPPNLRGALVTVVGMGKSGLSAFRLLRTVGACVTIVDAQEEASLQQSLSQLCDTPSSFRVGRGWSDGLTDAEWIVLSPGVPIEHPALDGPKELGIPIIGELELGSWFLRMPMIAVTGTNGKSTTVRLIGDVLRQAGKRPFVGGNIGVPLCEAALSQCASSTNATGSTEDYDCAVVEVSSFQLETIQRFRPWIAVFLNISPDHLDRHPSYEVYQAAKWALFRNQTASDYGIVNDDDPLIAAHTDVLSAQTLRFSLQGAVPRGVWLHEDVVQTNIRGQTEPLVSRGEIALRGDHNIANLMVAMAVGLLCECPMEALRHVARTCSGTEHVMEVVRQHEGVTYINDSKGTNVDATQKALATFHEPVVLIMGGKDKGGDFGQLRELIERRVTTVVAIGEARHRIAQELAGVRPLIEADGLEAAVARARAAASSGDVVLLSPACSSFDMFRSYDERGRAFKTIVQRLR